MKQTKKVISIVLAMMLLFCGVSFTAFAEEENATGREESIDKKEEELEKENVLDDTLVIAKMMSEYGGVIPVVPDTVFEKTDYYSNNTLGIAGNFHLVGFSSVETQTHTNGNILTRLLKYRSNFGTKASCIL